MKIIKLNMSIAYGIGNLFCRYRKLMKSPRTQFDKSEIKKLHNVIYTKTDTNHECVIKSVSNRNTEHRILHGTEDRNYTVNDTKKRCVVHLNSSSQHHFILLASSRGLLFIL
jgi:hypothetical protein